MYKNVVGKEYGPAKVLDLGIIRKRTYCMSE